MTLPLLLLGRPFRGLLSSLGLRARAPFLVVNPASASFLRQAGLTRVEDFLALPETIVSGHPDRQVSRVTLGTGSESVAAFLKKEHRVPWKERLANAWAGFGPVSKSVREALALRDLPVQAGAPEWIAAGESGDGRAFLLVREIPGAIELRRFLASRRGQPAARQFARKLGTILARLHDAGFVHGDLYANHVLVAPETEDVYLVDWQRSICGRVLTRPQRWRDLAALAATLTPELAGLRDRLAVLRAYLARWPLGGGRVLFRRAAADIAAIAKSMSRRRHVRAKRLPPLVSGSQSLICLDGNALNVTAAFRALWPASVPEILSWPALRTTQGEREVTLPDGGRAILVCGRHRQRRHQIPPERQRMSILFRLQRYGIEAPQVLAVGERPAEEEGAVVSFLLTRPPTGTIPLGRWLAGGGDNREQVLYEAGVLLARLHQAGCYARGPLTGLAVQCRPGESPRVVLERPDGLDVRRRFRGLWKRRNLARLYRETAAAGVSHSERLRLLDGYHNPLPLVPHKPDAPAREAASLAGASGLSETASLAGASGLCAAEDD